MVDFPNQQPASPWRRQSEAPEENILSTERTPLISRASEREQADQSLPNTSAAASLHGIHAKSEPPSRYRWPSLVALLVLCIVAVLIIVFAFIAPSAVEQYAAAAVVFAPTSLSIDSFTSTGVRARVQGNFEMDASRVENQAVRRLGRFCTWIATEAETGESVVEVSLPEYGNVLLGTAQIPGIKVYIRNGHTTPVDFLTDLQPGDVDGIRRIANDWIDGRLGQLRVVGKANVPVKSGLINLGKQFLQKDMIFANDDIPSIPSYDIKKLNFREVTLPTGKGMAADVSLKIQNPYPISFTIPPLGFGILVDNCEKSDPYIKLADALTRDIDISPSHPVHVNVTGTVRHLPSVLTQSCPGSTKSPLDNLVAGYIHGHSTTLYVRGSDSPSEDTPKWITDLISDITVPVPVPGKELGHLIKNFSLEDTHFSLPDPWAAPGSPERNPRITANVRALVVLPEEMNIPIEVRRVRADADVYYKSKKLGRLDLNKHWQKAKSRRVEGKSEMVVQARVKEAPLEIMDQEVFEDVVQELIFGDNGVLLTIKAMVDVGVGTAVGEVEVKGIPALGEVPVKRPDNLPPPGQGGSNKNGTSLADRLHPKLTNLRITNTTPSSLSLELTLNITNPTPYSASIPYIDIHLLKNGSLLGHATAQNLSLIPGNNSGLLVGVVWEPMANGTTAGAVGRELISQYISSYGNLTLGVRMYEGSFPGNGGLGRALGRWEVEVPLPSLSSTAPPGGDGEEPDEGEEEEEQQPHFMKDARMHLITSTATFVLLSPLKTEILWIEKLNATAFYDGEAAGGIFYDVPMGVLPLGQTEDGEGWMTPRLPVQWRVGSVGYRAIRAALGGTLRLGAYAEVGVRIGEWREGFWFRGGGLGVRIGL